MSDVVALPVDDLGTPVPVVGTPRRVVSLVPNLSEALWWWGRGTSLVGVTDWCTSPPDGFPHAVRVRGTKNPDVAAVVGLEPDLVVVNVDENRELDVRRLRGAGLAVWVTAARDPRGAARSLARLGEVVGAAAPARATADRLLTAVERDRPTGGGVLPRVAVPVWRDPWMAIGRDTVVGELLVELGFQLVPDAPRYPAVERDDLLEADLVLLPDEPWAFGEDDRRELLAASPRAAVRLFDGQLLTWWGPRTPALVSELAELRRHLVRRAARRARRDA